MTIEEGADRIVGQCLAVGKGENVLIIADNETRTVGDAIFHATRRVEAVPVLTLIYPAERHSQEPPGPLARLMLESDAVVIVTKMSMTHTKARAKATKAGARVVSIPGVTDDMMSEGAINADHHEIARALTIMGRKLRNARKVHIISGGGTDFSFSTKGREWITEDNGLATHRGDVTTLPAGEIFIAPIEGSAEGRLVFDVLLLDPLEQPATLFLKEGYAQRVSGSKSTVAEMNKGGKDGRNLGKFGIGMNPRARMRGPPVEAQKALGVVHVVFGGSAPFGGRIVCDVRIDGIMSDATVEADGKTIMERGKPAV